MEKDRNKGGRPRLTAADKRETQIRFYVNDDEFSEIEDRRKKCEKTRAVFLRDLIFGNRILIPEINSDALKYISRASSNLNQIARKVNSNSDLGNVKKELNDIKKMLRGIHFLIVNGGKNEIENYERE